MNKTFAAIAASVILATSLIGGMRHSSKRVRPAASAQPTRTMPGATENIENDYSEAVTTVSNNYAGEIDYEKATQAAIQGMLFTLDPHSAFFPYSEFKKLKEDQDSRFYGIGVTSVAHRDAGYIQSAVEGTPAAKLGDRYGCRNHEDDGQ